MSDLPAPELVPAECVIQAADYIGNVLSWAPRESTTSHAKGVDIEWDLEALILPDGTTEPQRGLRCWGTVWFIKANGAGNEPGLCTLCELMGWSADTEDLTDDTKWKPTGPYRITVKAEEYKGETRFKVDNVNPVTGSRPRRKLGTTRMKEWSDECGDVLAKWKRGERISEPNPTPKTQQVKDVDNAKEQADGIPF